MTFHYKLLSFPVIFQVCIAYQDFSHYRLVLKTEKNSWLYLALRCEFRATAGHPLPVASRLRLGVQGSRKICILISFGTTGRSALLLRS